jgi:CBS domain-containing protein
MAYTPAVEVSPTNTVKHAVSAALPANCDAVAVVESSRLVGIFTSRDVLLKIVLERRDPQTTLVGDVMTKGVVTLHPDTDPERALQLMLENNFRHLPLSEDGKTVCGMLSMRKVLNHIVQDQQDNLLHLESFLNADGPGG